MKAIAIQKPLSEQAYETLVDAICDGTLAPGERLTQDGMARRLAVSRLPVGQALRRLHDEGFVVQAGRRGLKVAPLDDDAVRTLYEFRSGVDQISAGLAARRAGASDCGAGERILERGRRAAASHDVGELIEADMAFHWFVYRLAGNPVMQDVMQTQWHHIRRVMLNILTEERNQAPIWHEHEAILKAICAGDVELAERLARAHVDDASAWLRGALRGRDPKSTEAAGMVRGAAVPRTLHPGRNQETQP